MQQEEEDIGDLLDMVDSSDSNLDEEETKMFVELMAPSWSAGLNFKTNTEKPKRRLWKPEEDDELKGYYLKGMFYKDIAEAMGRGVTERSVSNRVDALRELGQLPLRENVRWTKLDNEKLTRLRQEGFSIEEIGKKMRRKPESVQAQLAHLT